MFDVLGKAHKLIEKRDTKLGMSVSNIVSKAWIEALESLIEDDNLRKDILVLAIKNLTRSVSELEARQQKLVTDATKLVMTKNFDLDKIGDLFKEAAVLVKGKL